MDDRAPLADLGRLVADVLERDRLGVVNEICVPPSKSIPRFSPLTMSAPTVITSTTPEIANQIFRLPMKSICIHGPLLAGRAHEPRAVEPRKPASSPSIARVAKTAVTIEMAVPTSSMSAKPFTPAVASDEEDERRDRRDDVGVDDRVEALRVARRDRRAHGFARARLLFDAFEDDDVRVGRDADRQDHPREARQRHRHVEEQDHRVEEDGVDPEADHRDQAEEAVDEQQEERDERSGRRPPPQRLPQRVLAERGRDLRLRQRAEVHGQRAGLEDERDLLRLVVVADAGDLR